MAQTPIFLQWLSRELKEEGRQGDRTSRLPTEAAQVGDSARYKMIWRLPGHTVGGEMELFHQAEVGERLTRVNLKQSFQPLERWLRQMTAFLSHLWPFSWFPLRTRELIAPLNGHFLLMHAFAVIQHIISRIDTDSPSPLNSTITAFGTLEE